MLSAVAAYADPLNVLWYTGGTEPTSPPGGTYEANITSSLAMPGTGDPSSTNWNITFWQGGAVPAGTFNVLVVPSLIGPWSPGPNYTALNAALPTLTFGNRELVSGQDADWHVQNTPGATNFNGPRGFLRDAINWAGSGTGLGLVAMGDFAGLGLTGLGSLVSGSGSFVTNNVVIPAAFASFPINTNLTTAGLSNWNDSAHTGWTGSDTSLWTGINIDGDAPCPSPPDSTCHFVTLVTASEAGGGIGTVPLPAALPLFATGLGALGLLGWRRKKKAAALAA
jgi:hypothetical protein